LPDDAADVGADFLARLCGALRFGAAGSSRAL